MAHLNLQPPLPMSLSRRLLPWIVWGLSCVFYLYECLLQVSPSVMSNELMRDFAVTSQTLGLLSGIYFYSYAAMQLPGGVLMDYFGPKRLLILASTICGLSTLFFAVTHSFYMACFARLMIGLGSAFAAVGTMKLASTWFPAQRFAFLTGSMVTLGMLGAIGGEAPLALLIGSYGWREAMFILGIAGLVIAFLILLIVKDKPSDPEHYGLAPHVDHSAEGPLFSNFSVFAKNTQLWLVATYGGLMYLATPVFCGLWGVPFLMLKMGVSKPVAANYVSLIFIGWAIASPLWGIFSNRIGKRKPSLYIASVGGLFTCLLFIYMPLHKTWLMEVMLLAFGLFSAGFLPAFAIAKEICNRNQVASGLGFMNMMNMIGIAFAQPLVGWILDKNWSGQMQNNIRIYSLNDYYFALLILPLALFFALLILPRIKETYCQNIEA